MFGEETIYGKKEITVDKKSRFILPTFTRAEENDKVVIKKEDDILSIYPKHKLDKIMEDLKHALLIAKDVDEYNKIKDRMEKIYLTCISVEKCDAQRRIVLSNKCFDAKGENKCMVVGFGDHIKVYTLEKYKGLSSK